VATSVLSTPSAVAPASRHARRRADVVGFRADIEGLRALAVLLVLAYHAGVAMVPGGYLGVDVFFVISGFLITGLLLREVHGTGQLSLVGFYARRIRRLLPATALVLTATAALTLAFLPPIRWGSIARDLAASAGYVINWRLADQTVNYLGSEQARSPVQHFWSLAVEEQFYLVWPLIILLVVVSHRRSGWSLDRTLLVALGLIAVPSFVWSVHLTGSEPGRAYFVSTTRLWELAVGAALAITAPRLQRLPVLILQLLGWLGLAGIAYAAVTFDSTTLFPGVAALVPSLATAAVIAAGAVGPGRGVSAMLGVAPMRNIGALSYSLYLWHWPLLVAAAAAWGELSTAEGLAVVTFCAIPAWLAYRLVESPIHHAKRFVVAPSRAIALGVLCTAVGIGGAVVVHAAVPAPKVSGSTSGPIGAAVLGSHPASDPDGVPVDEVSDLVMDALAARNDNSPIYHDGCHLDQKSTDLKPCIYGDRTSDQVVALVGDSHAGQWVPALESLAKEHGWRLETYTKSSCGFFTVPVWVAKPPVEYTSCGEWNANLLARLTAPNRPDLVITAGSNLYGVLQDGRFLNIEDSKALFVQGLRRTWQAVTAAGIPLLVIRATARGLLDVPDCISANPGRLSRCATLTKTSMGRAGDSDLLAARDLPRTRVVDLTAAICPGRYCPAIIGRVIVWRDGHHLTATYARSLAPRLDKVLSQLMPATER
jgi:peptidoglycan/LPS O-acetylase OafA/YrhL